MATSGKPVIVKRKRAGAHTGGHGGAWKIAYADFMTAMMAFFLVMWLLLISSKEQLAGIAEQFRMPLKAALEGGPRSSTSSSVIPGGGADPVRTEPAEVRHGDDGADDTQRLQDLKSRLDDIVESNPELKELRPQLKIDITPDGLRIQIVDTQNRPMFELASARVLPHMRLILQQIGPTLNTLPNKVTLAGHTDATLYANGRSYGNWELSADRANASRRELVAGGMREERVLRVMGLASSTPLNSNDPADPMNRRISIVVLNHAAQSRIEQEMAAGRPRAAPVPAAADQVARPPAQIAPATARPVARL